MERSAEKARRKLPTAVPQMSIIPPIDLKKPNRRGCVQLQLRGALLLPAFVPDRGGFRVVMRYNDLRAAHVHVRGAGMRSGEHFCRSTIFSNGKRSKAPNSPTPLA